MEKETKKFMPFNKKGQVGIQGAVGGVIFLIVGLGVATLIQIFVGVLGGKTYQLVEGDIDAITNTTIRSNIKAGIASSFEANQQTGELMPVVALAFMVILVLGLLLSLFRVGGGGFGGGGSVL